MAQKGCLEHLQEHGDSSAREVADSQRIAPTSVKRNMRSLIRKGLVEEDESSKPHIYKLTEDGENEDTENFGGMVV